jgi:7-carboxy-7-deazaguanine synthase
MSYSVKSIFYTLQGEGARAGWPAVFCRFSGCNLWNGIEADRASSKCWFCDTDFVGMDGENGGRFTSAKELGHKIASLWPNASGNPYVVFTGGEPMLQLDQGLIDVMKQLGFTIAIETNGTQVVPDTIDWITVSPKPNTDLVQRVGNEIKLVFPHQVRPEELAELAFEHRYLSPLWTCNEEERRQNLKSAISYVLANPSWKLTSQLHKLWDIP